MVLPMAAIELLPYQQRCFKDRSRFKSLMWSREELEKLLP